MATGAAKRYARAVFEIAQQDGDLEQWSRRLTRVRELFADESVAAVLSNPTIATERREALVRSDGGVLRHDGALIVTHDSRKTAIIGKVSRSTDASQSDPRQNEIAEPPNEIADPYMKLPWTTSPVGVRFDSATN